MEARNGDCFDHDPLFGPLPTESTNDHACFKDFLLEPSTHDKMGCDGMYYPKSSFTSMDAYGCNNGNMINMPNSMHVSSYLNVSNPDSSFLPSYDAQSCAMAPNTSMMHYNNNNLHCNDYPLVDSGLPFIPVGSIGDDKALAQSLIPENHPLGSGTTSEILSSFTKNLAPDPLVPVCNDSFDLIGNNNSNFIASPLFTAETLPVSKIDSDPFSPSISSSVSSIPSVEMADKSSYVPGSVDSGVVVNGSSSSPFSTTDSNRNGECSSINDSLISPLTQELGSERSVETTPGSESVSSEMCSPRVDFEMLSLEMTGKSEVKPKEKSHKGRKRKNETKKDRAAKTKKHPVIVPTYQSQISPSQNGIKLKISLTTPGPIPVNKKRRRSRKPTTSETGPLEQSGWGSKLPEFILKDIFRLVAEADGCMPSLLRLSQVCSQWRNVALYPDLWYNIDLANKWVSKNPVINDYNFTWLCENRLTKVQELNLANWTFSKVPVVLDKIAKNCSELSGFNMSGWENLNADHVKFVVSNCSKLQRVTLSGVSSNQSSNNKSGVALNSLLFMAKEMGERLTHLVLSDNKLVGIPQIISAISENCPNLEVLDLSNVRTLTATGHIHIEKVQEGCPNLRILRITNSQVSLAPLSLKEQMASPGFPHLEELSVACSVNSLSSLTQPFIDDESIERILKTSTKLKLLDARNCLKVTDSSLVRVPAWDLTHLYLSGSYVTRTNDSGLELIAQKWSHSLIEVDFAWSTVTKSLDAAVFSLAEQGDSSSLKILDLTGSSVNLPPVQAVLKRCSHLTSLNLSSCRALPRGMKRLYNGHSLHELKESFNKSAEELSGENGKGSPQQ